MDDNGRPHAQDPRPVHPRQGPAGVVDVEALLAYSDLVIFGYRECLCCGSQRSAVDAVQQHMKGKGAVADLTWTMRSVSFCDFCSFPKHETDDGRRRRKR